MTRHSLRFSWIPLAFAALLVAGALAPAAAAPPAAPTDDLVGQVLTMFQSGISEPVITNWLEKSGRHPEQVTSADLVALHKAGASDEFLKKLVDLASRPTAAPAAPPAAQPIPAAPAAAPAAPFAPAPAPPAASPAPAASVAPAAAAAAGTASTTVKVRLAVTYRPVFLEEEDPWTLFVYLDGRAVASVEAIRLPVPLPAKRFDLELAPGPHVLRLAEERRMKYSRVKGYLSPSRVDPDDFALDLQPGKVAEVDVWLGERSIRRPGPVEVKLRENGSDVAQKTPERGNPETWPAICDDIATALPAGARENEAARRDKKNCLPWSDLWHSTSGVPSRAEVRAQSERKP